jgi:hypothetical protein
MGFHLPNVGIDQRRKIYGKCVAPNFVSNWLNCCRRQPASQLAKLTAQNESTGVFHVFAFQWKEGTSEAQKESARKEISAFQGVIPGLLHTHVGSNISARGKGYTFGGIMQFKDEASLNAYFHHPAHLKLLAWLVPLIDAIELDLRD